MAGGAREHPRRHRLHAEQAFSPSPLPLAEIFGHTSGEVDGGPVRWLDATQEGYEDVGRPMAAVAHDEFVTHERGMAGEYGRLI